MWSHCLSSNIAIGSLSKWYQKLMLMNLWLAIDLMWFLVQFHDEPMIPLNHDLAYNVVSCDLDARMIGMTFNCDEFT